MTKQAYEENKKLRAENQRLRAAASNQDDKIMLAIAVCAMHAIVGRPISAGIERAVAVDAFEIARAMMREREHARPQT